VERCRIRRRRTRRLAVGLDEECVEGLGQLADERVQESVAAKVLIEGRIETGQPDDEQPPVEFIHTVSELCADLGEPLVDGARRGLRWPRLATHLLSPATPIFGMG